MDEKLFEELYKEYYNRIFSYCYNKIYRKDIAVSVANDTFLLLRDKWNELDFKPDPGKIIIWLTRTASFKLKETIREENSKIVVENIENYENKLFDLSTLSTEASSDKLTYREYLFLIKGYLDKAEADIFELLVIQSMRQQEAADRLGITVGALKMKWHRLKPKIKRILSDIKKNNL